MPRYPSNSKAPKSLVSGVGKTIMKSYKIHIPKYDLPLRLRPWFLAFTCIIMVMLALLGFTNFSRSLPLNDKLLHFVCFTLATGVFYFIVDVDESARRVWFWRYFGLLFTFFTCFFCGGILSEFVQAMFPYKEFQMGDVVANLLGSGVGLVVSYHLEKYYRYRREISRLYQPLDSDSLSDFEDDLETLGTQLLPTHHTNRGPVGINGVAVNGKGKEKKKKKGNVRFADVSDEREVLFGIGEVSEEEDEESLMEALSRPPNGANRHSQKQPMRAVLSDP